jgi:CRISP-associated protein Cas1
MGAEGTFRRSAWEVIDTKLPDWLRLDGRADAFSDGEMIGG